MNLGYFFMGLLLVAGICVAIYYTWKEPGIPIAVKGGVIALEIMILLGGAGLMQSAFNVAGGYSIRRS